jgi:glutaminyl-peptide cyclotransferase
MKPALLFSILILTAAPMSLKAGAVAVVSPVIVRSIPHDTLAFTQGLFWHGGLLYESTGLYGRSSLRCIDPKSGRVMKTIPVADIFAEGIARLDSSLVQLSWRESAAIVYSFPSLQTRGSFSYIGEGWGLTADAGSFIMSNGSDTLFVRNKQFRVTRALAVTLNGKPLGRLNELEYVKGLVYANVWFDNSIYAIRLKTGSVVRIVNCASLVEKNGARSDQDVLNGIAYDNVAGTFYITGKNWRYIFEVRLK